MDAQFGFCWLIYPVMPASAGLIYYLFARRDDIPNIQLSIFGGAMTLTVNVFRWLLVLCIIGCLLSAFLLTGLPTVVGACAVFMCAAALNCFIMHRMGVFDEDDPSVASEDRI